MPTPDSAAAFARLVEARTRLSELSVDLRNALESRGQSSAAEQRFRQVQQQWDEAFQAFQAATDQFSAVVHGLHRPDVDGDV